MFTVLFTSIGRRVELVQAFKNSYLKQMISARILGADSNPLLAPAGHFVDGIIQIPRVNETGYLRTLLQICRKERVDLLIPLYEPEFSLMDQHRDQFKKVKTLLLLSTTDTLKTCADKLETYRFFNEFAINTPKTWPITEKLVKDRFPLFVKPRSGMGSVGACKVNSQNELDFFTNRNPDLIVQDCITGIEYTLDTLSNLNGEAISIVPRERLQVRSGEVAKSRTVKRPDLIQQGKQIIETLEIIGPATLQCIDDGLMVYWIEINPRFGGGVPLSIRAGVDYPYLLYKMSTGEPLQPILGKYQTNLTMLRYDQSVYF
ncbi:MAG: ATP-grasp domain-containing protein [Firmicutes bacterium]|nr:ATP-grasp domain-containing protein [Bacillota bacterium]